MSVLDDEVTRCKELDDLFDPSKFIPPRINKDSSNSYSSSYFISLDSELEDIFYTLAQTNQEFNARWKDSSATIILPKHQKIFHRGLLYSSEN